MKNQLVSYLFEDDLAKYRNIVMQYAPPPMNIRKGTIICKKGYTCGWLYFLLEGMVKVYTTNFVGYDRILCYCKRNTLCGMDCLNPEEPSCVTIESVTDISMVPLTGDILRKIISCNKDIAYDIILYYSKLVRQLSFDSENLSINDTSIRLANFLYLYRVTPSYIEQARIDMTQEALASAVNSTRSQIAKICAKLKKEGIIKPVNKGIVILNDEKLFKYCHFS